MIRFAKPPGKQFHLVRRLVPLIVVATAAAILTACGGGSDSSSDPSSAHYDPAKTTLKAAGLEVCGEEQQQAPSGLTEVPGVALTRIFAVAEDCHGATTSPNTVMVFQFTSKETIDAGEKAIQAALPKAVVHQTYPLVIAATGPNKEENMTAIVAQIPKH